MSQRSLFLTEEQYVGICSPQSQPGDQICVTLGCQAPLILQPTTAGRFQIVGDCYLQGFMDGEAILGPLPTDYDRIVQVSPDTGINYSAYIDCRSGTIQVLDPRLGPLPNHWRLKFHEHELLWSWFVNDETGEGREDLSVDPRLTPDALRKQGVNLEDFILV